MWRFCEFLSKPIDFATDSAILLSGMLKIEHLFDFIFFFLPIAFLLELWYNIVIKEKGVHDEKQSLQT